MTFNFEDVQFKDIEGNVLNDFDFERIFGAEKRKLVANVLWRNCPNAEIAAICLNILEGKKSEISKSLAQIFSQHIENSISSFPVKQPILQYLKSMVESTTLDDEIVY